MISSHRWKCTPHTKEKPLSLEHELRRISGRQVLTRVKLFLVDTILVIQKEGLVYQVKIMLSEI